MTASRQHHLLGILAMLSMSLLTGCQSQQHVRDADRYMRLRDYPSAVAHYQEALRLKPSLSQNPAFMGSLHDAQRENALAVSNTLLASDQPENAVDALDAHHTGLPPSKSSNGPTSAGTSRKPPLSSSA
ncbi:MAG: tetratricopeptide repeat protein [Phycisphaeraceae bacterium]